MQYLCEKCNYTTNRKYDWDKHTNTIKHQNNVKKIYTCKKCDKIFNTNSALYKHGFIEILPLVCTQPLCLSLKNILKYP